MDIFSNVIFSSYGLKKDVTKGFSNEKSAFEAMHKLMNEYNLSIVESYKDKFGRMFKCNSGVEFYINQR